MKWYKKQIDKLLKKEKKAEDKGKGKPAFEALKVKPRRIVLPNHMEKRSRNKTDAIS